MLKKSVSWWSENSFWTRVVFTCLILFFVYLGDAVLSDWVPGYMQEKLGGSMLMGLVMSFSSLVGFGADLVFPQLLKGASSKRLVILAIGTSLVFSGVLLWSIVWPTVWVFLIAMAVWGLYYEFLGFGSFQFVSENVPPHGRSGVWAIFSVFKSLAYFLGPILGSMVALKVSNEATVSMAAFWVILGYVLWKFAKAKGKVAASEEANEKLNLVDEIEHWVVLFKHVWPILIVSVTMGLIDATYWTTGTVLSDKLALQNWWGGMFLPLYMLPPVFVGFIVARWGIYKGKKKMAEKFMLLGGIFLTLLGVSDATWVLLLASFLTGASLSVAWPLTDAVYSDILERMGRERKHLVGLSSSTISLAYIIGPIMAGYIASLVGERMTFVVMGGACVVISLVLLVITPKKLKLPQREIRTWK